MNTYSHILMGRFLCRYVERHFDIQLDRGSFILGNVLPDYSPSFLLRPHFVKNNIMHIQKTIRLLTRQNASAYNSKRNSRLLGILCHFYADSLCYAHNDGFTGGLSGHIQYEKRQYGYFMEHLRQINSFRFVVQKAFDKETGGLYRRFEKLHASYLLTRPSFANDLSYTIMACIEAIVLACGCAAAERTERTSHSLNRLQAV